MDNYNAGVPETGVMLKGLNRYFSVEDLQSLFARMELAYDFLYLPWDSRHNHNIGLCFVNFVDVASADRCIQTVAAMLTSQGDKAKSVRSVSKSHVHGMGPNLAYFLVSAGMSAMNNDHAPLVFDNNGRPVSLRWAIKQNVTIDLLLALTDFKDRLGRAARGPSSTGPVGEDQRLAEATWDAQIEGRGPFYQQSTARQQPQPLYFEGDFQATAYSPHISGLHVSQNRDLVEPRLPQALSHQADAHHHRRQPLDSVRQQYHQAPRSNPSVFRVGEHDVNEFTVFEF